MELKFVSRSVSSCNMCDKTFFDGNDLSWHTRKQHLGLGWPDMPFKWDLCGAAYIRKIELQDHTKKHHSLNSKPTVEEIDDKEGDKASVKHKKQEKNDSSWLEKIANMKITPSMYNVNVDVVKRERYQVA